MADKFEPPPPPLPKPVTVDSTAPTPAQTVGRIDLPESPTDLVRTPVVIPVPVHFTTISFTGFSPNDGASSLFRLWRGDFEAIRSDGEEFSVAIAFKQSDTPYVTGPMIQASLDMLMGYASCGCRPSKRVVCASHDGVVAIESAAGERMPVPVMKEDEPGAWGRRVRGA